MNKYCVTFSPDDFQQAVTQLLSPWVEQARQMNEKIKKMFQSLTESIRLSIVQQQQQQRQIKRNGACFKLQSQQQRTKQLNANFAMAKQGKKWSHSKRKSKRK